MFSLASGLYEQYFSPQHINLLIVGVQGAGKTTCLERIKVIDFTPTTWSGRIGGGDHSGNATTTTTTRKNTNKNMTATTATTSNNNNNATTMTTASSSAMGLESTIASLTKTTTTTSLLLSSNSNSVVSEDHEPYNRRNTNHNITTTTTTTNNTNNKGNQKQSAPEHLRTKIFVSDNPQNFDIPLRSLIPNKKDRNKKKKEGSPPISRFGWICPPPPKFILDSTTTSNNNKNTSKKNWNNRKRTTTTTTTTTKPLNDKNRRYKWSTNDDNDMDNDDDDDDNNSIETTSGHWSGLAGQMMDTDDDENESLLSAKSEQLQGSDRGNRHGSRTTLFTRSNSNPNLLEPHGGGPPGLPRPRRFSKRTTSGNSNCRMESIDLGNGTSNTPNNHQSSTCLPKQIHVQEPPTPQYNLKSGTKMLSLEKIRPTIGTNLMKTDICGAKVHIFDVGGKLHNLWDRYYADADAVLFVWKLCRPEDSPIQQHCNNHNHYNSIPDTLLDEKRSLEQMDEYSNNPVVTSEQQRHVLEQVRSAVPDDIPFVVLGHLFQMDPPYNCEPDVWYSTSQLLPHYHNPNQGLFFGNAVTGQGLKTCLEWLIGNAMRQQKNRQRMAYSEKH